MATSPSKVSTPQLYRTTDIKFASFLKAKQVQLVGHGSPRGPGGGGLKEFHFAIDAGSAAALNLHYQNHTPEAQVDASTLLNEYENLKALRYT